MEYKVINFGHRVTAEDIEAKLNEMGTDGWILVGVAHLPHNEAVIACFGRRKVESVIEAAA